MEGSVCLRKVDRICIFMQHMIRSLHFYLKRDSVNVKLFFEYFVMRGKANYVCVKLFQKKYRGPSCFCLVHTRCKD